MSRPKLIVFSGKDSLRVPYLLNLIYLLLILISLPWLLWQSLRKDKYRDGYAAKFFGIVPTRTSISDSNTQTPQATSRELTAPGEKQSKQKCLWLHAVSVGEVNLLAPLLKKIAQERPAWECVISTTTATGMALAQKKYPQHTVFYCPLDFSWAVDRALRHIRPDILVLAELELWPNLIRAAKRHGARVAVINGRLGEKSFRGYRKIRPLVARLLREIDLLAIQDETYAERFRQLGARPETIHVTGSMKYDGAPTDRNNSNTKRLARLAGFADDDIVLLAGSTQEPEEQMALEVFSRLACDHKKLRLVVVPRHPERFDAVANLLDKSGVPWQRRTRLNSDGPEGSLGLSEDRPHPSSFVPPPSRDSSSPVPRPHPPAPRVLLVDVVGELGAWWGTATIAFVGGSMGSRGGQNMIEPAAYGAAVSFGPNTWNFRDIVTTMLEQQAAVVVETQEQFAAFVRRCLEEPAYAAELGRRAQSLVLAQLGATQETLAFLDELLARKEGLY